MLERASEAAQAEVAAALLGLGRRLDLASLLLSAAALVVLGLAPPPMPACSALLLALAFGLAEHYHALRTAFDATVFAAWAARWHAGGDPLQDLAAFDQALAGGGLRAAPDTVRALPERVAGARRLFRRQGLCLLLQLAAWLAAVAFILRPL